MTKDTTPHLARLSKYLESDDPVNIQIGLSMVNRTNVTLEDWLEWGSKLPLKTSYHLAKKAGIEHSDDVIKTLCKRLGDYNTDDTIIQEIIRTKDIQTVWWALRSATLEALENPTITDEDIGVIQDGFSQNYHLLHTQLHRILCYSDKHFVDYLINILNQHNPDNKGPSMHNTVSQALNEIKDNRYRTCLNAAEILGEIADIRAVKPLSGMLQDQTGSERDYHSERRHTSIHNAGKKALEKIAEANVEGDEKKNILKFLKSDDEGMVIMGASMLEGILEE
mgnify:FL=1